MLDLPVGAAAQVGIACTSDFGATGQITNTATVERPQGTSDLDLTDNTAVRTDGVVRRSDLSITKSDGAESSPPGGSVTYTLVVSNAGPSDVVGAAVTDTFSAPFEAPMWSCSPGPEASCTAGPVAGNLSDTVAIPAGGSVTYFATAGIDIEATGALLNTAAVLGSRRHRSRAGQQQLHRYQRTRPDGRSGGHQGERSRSARAGCPGDLHGDGQQPRPG